MRAIRLHQRETLALVSILVGLAACQATGTSFGLIAPLAALFLYMSGATAAVVNTGLALAAAVLAVTAGLAPLEPAEVARNLAAFCAVAFSVGTVAVARRARNPSTDAKRIIDAMPGHAWSADPAGRFTYVSPRTLAYLGSSAEDLAPLPDSNEFGWRRVVHPDDDARVIAAWRRSLATGELYDSEHRIRRHDGVYRWFRNAGIAARDEDGRITGWHGTTIDISDQKRAEAALAERERELSTLVAMVPSHLWRLSPDGEPVFFNRRMVAFLGFDVDVIAPSGVSRLELLAERVHPDDRPLFRAALGASLLFGDSFHLRYRLHRADGVHRWISSCAEPLHDGDGDITGWYGLCVDIDDQVRTEETLRRSEQQLRQLIDTVPIQVWCTTPAGAPDHVNRTMADFLGLSPADAGAASELPRALDARVHEDDRERLHAALDRSFASGEPFELRFRTRRRDGVYRWVEGRANPLRDEGGRVIRWYGANVDIDDLVRAKDELRDRECELSKLVDMVPGLLWRLAPDGEPTFFNRRMEDYFDTPATDFTAERGGLAASLAAHVHPEDVERARGALAHALATGDGFSLTHRLRRSDGVYRWMSVSAEALRNEDGTIRQWYGICNDIDDQLRIEEALRERERFLWHLVETLPAMVVCSAPDGEPVYRSEQLRTYLGYDVDASDGTGQSRLEATLNSAIHPDDRAAVKALYAHSLATGEPYRRRHRLRRFDGVYHWVDTRAAPMRDETGTIVQWNLICLDIDGEVRAEEALRLAQERLARAGQAASLAELSASIAHEVNQPLAAVVANAQACHRWLSATPPNLDRARITAERITRDANAAADVVGRVRALFRQAPGIRTCTGIADFLAEAVEVLADEAMRRRVRIVIDVPDGIMATAMDRVQIVQVLTNLVRNGMDAMEHVADGAAVHVTARQDKHWLRVEVADCGTGIAAPARIFEPFFTTKDKGMGMGLAICRSIVEAHGGRLWAEKNEPQGARFVFTLPVDATAAA